MWTVVLETGQPFAKALPEDFEGGSEYLARRMVSAARG
jgi:hypothetical protein